MISVFIDTQQISQDFYLDQQQINNLLDYTVKEITARFAQEWQNEANRTLNEGRAEYVNSIIVVDEGFAKGAVMLVGEFPNMLESEAPSFDMKPGLLAGPNAKVGNDGKKYNTVPFTFGTPGALAENFSNIMPQPVYDVIKNKPLINDVKGGGKSSTPLKKSEIPQQFRQPEKKQVKEPESQSFKDYQHKHSIYEGMIKKQDPVTKQNRYSSFRRVSEASDPLSWIHPGFEGKGGIAEKALADFNVPSELGRALDSWYSKNL